MATFPEIADLFSQLASHLQTLTRTSPTDNQAEEEEEGEVVSYSIDLSISKLNRSLNLTEDVGVRVLDTALSLMCFKATQVFDSVIEYLVKTIVSVLSSSISCTVLPFEKEELLRVGSPISGRDCLKFIEVVNDVISKLDERGMPSHLLLCAAARVAVSTSCYRYLVPSMHILDVKPIDKRNIAISKLLCRFPREFSLNNHEIPLRLLSWYLDPLTLKHDISNIMKDIMKRPFLSPSKEFYERMEWRSVLMCLVLSPIMFVHTRALLHDWLMLTGLAPILHLLNELVAVILDVICRPTWWGLSMELGSKLPFSKAYFPHKHRLLRTLAGPLSSSSFLQLVHKTSISVSLVKQQLGLASKPSAPKIASIDSKSIWAMVICFPDWFYFASVLLFSNNSFQKNFQLKFTLGIPEFRQTSAAEQHAAAARYIAWMLSPNNKSDQDLLFHGLTKISDCWTRLVNSSGTCYRETAGYWKKLKKHIGHDMKEDFSFGDKCDCEVICLWLKEFESFMKCGDESIEDSSSREAESYTFVSRNSMFLRRIPLGILIGCSSYVKEDGFELLLHYAATGKMLHPITNDAITKHLERNSEEIRDFGLVRNEFNKNEAVAGACLVFSLTDIVERMSASLSSKEKSGLDIFCQVKLRASRYLIKCINRLILRNRSEDRNVMLVDLYDRLERWRHQGQEMLRLDKDVDDAIKALSDKLLLL